jgi:quinohemoprotein ethanol dehydrogenase
MLMIDQPGYKWTKGTTNVGSGGMLGFILDIVSPADRKMFDDAFKARPDLPSPMTKEVLIAWDPVAQREKWRVPIGTGDWAGGGVLTTASNLVIQGTSGGHLMIYRAETGEKLHDLDIGTAIMAAPISYEIDGEQYVAVLAGFGGAVAPTYPRDVVANTYQNYGRILAFKLGGGATPLPPRHEKSATPDAPALAGYSDALAERGAPLFFANCAVCHGGRGEGRHSSYPDLHRLPPEVHAAFDSIVLGGKLKDAGMSSFADLLKPEEVTAIHAYLVREQKTLQHEEELARGH